MDGGKSIAMGGGDAKNVRSIQTGEKKGYQGIGTFCVRLDGRFPEGRRTSVLLVAIGPIR